MFSRARSDAATTSPSTRTAAAPSVPPSLPPGEAPTQVASPLPQPEATPGGDEPPGGTRLERGDAIGRYVVLEKLGAGGMGVVYSAYDPELDRKVALKLIRPGAGSRPDIARLRLLREAQALAKL